MAYKQTIAIIGATTTTGAVIATGIAASYRLLLMDTNLTQLEGLQQSVLAHQPKAEVEVLNCCRDASWEADLIVVAVEDEKLEGSAARMKEVSTCKPVVYFPAKGTAVDQLQQLLPHAKVATVVLSHPLSVTNSQQAAVIYGKAEASIRLAESILAAIGCMVQPA